MECEKTRPTSQGWFHVCPSWSRNIRLHPTKGKRDFSEGRRGLMPSFLENLPPFFDNLAHPEPDELNQVPGTIYPEVKWSLVKFKPVLPHPESCPLYSCSQDPSFYEDHITGCLNPCFKNARIQTKFLQRNPFGSLPGFVTNLGVVAVPEAPVGGYVYCAVAKRWMIYATIPTTEGGGRSRRGSLPSGGRRKG